jgi:uncharacterized protein YggT (Ycf19 family)
MTQTENQEEEITVVENTTPKKVIRTTRKIAEPEIKTEHPQKVFEKKKTIFRFYQIIWYALTVIEFLLGFRFFLKAFGANPFNSFANFIYALSDPFALPFSGLFRSGISNSYVIEWSTLFAMVVYLLVAYGLVEIFQFVKPVTKEEVEQTVDEQ